MSIVLARMGYREMKPGFWGKPIGGELLLYVESEARLKLYFRTHANGPSLWEDAYVGLPLDESDLVIAESDLIGRHHGAFGEGFPFTDREAALEELLG